MANHGLAAARETAGTSVARREAAAPALRGKGDRRGALFAGGSVLGALAMSSCCIVPLVLFSLGITGAWLGSLAAMSQYQWIFILATAGFLGSGFYMVYRKAPAAECVDGYCARPLSNRINKIVLWAATVLALVALAFPYVAPILLET